MAQQIWKIELMAPTDFEAVLALWKVTEGMGLGAGDERRGIESFLERNPGLSLVAREHGTVVGAVLCGHDGRRGYLHHLAVAGQHRNQGIGTALADACLARLASAGISRCLVVVHGTNETAQEFWRQKGWRQRTEVRMWSLDVAPDSKPQ